MKKKILVIVCLFAISGCSPTNDPSSKEELSYSSFHPASSPVIGVNVDINNKIFFADREGRFYTCKEGGACQIKFKRSIDLIGYFGGIGSDFILERDDKISPISLTSISKSGETVYELVSTPGEEIYSFDAYEGKRIAVGRGETMCVDLMDYDSGKMIYRFCIYQGNRMGVVGALKFNPQGDKLAVAPFLGECHIWDIKQKKVFKRFELPDDGTQVASRSLDQMVFSSNGEKIYVSTQSTVYKSAITVFSIADGVVHAQSKAIEGIIRMKISPDDKSIAAIETGGKKRILLLDTNTLKIKQVVAQIAQEDKGKNYFSCLNFSPDGKRLVVGDSTGEVRVYNLNDGSTT